MSAVSAILRQGRRKVPNIRGHKVNKCTANIYFLPKYCVACAPVHLLFLQPFESVVNFKTCSNGKFYNIAFVDGL